MIEENIDIGEPLLIQIGRFGNIAWINQFYDLVNKVLTDLGIDYNDERLSLSVTKDAKLPVILGQRYILQPLKNERIKCIVPSTFKLKDIDGIDYDWYFSPETARDAKWIEVAFPVGGELPPRLYESILTTCKAILKKSTKSGFRKHHSQLLYGFVTDKEVRKDILEMITSNGLLKKGGPILSDLIRLNRSLLLTWNPQRWNWEDYNEKVKEVHEKGSTLMRWSCGNSKNIKVDDQVFLMRVGSVSPGIIGSGYVVEAPFKDIHFADEDREALYVEVAFDTLLDFKKDILRLEVLKKEMPEQLWTPQASGISIRNEYLSKLEQLWFEYQNISLEQKPEYNQPETEQTFLEGKAFSVLQSRYERDADARKACLSKKGYRCSVCSFDFQKVYGGIGVGFIHVHHLNMVKDMGEPTETNPETDLEPVCPNCHAMLHKRYPPYSINELKELIKDQLKDGM